MSDELDFKFKDAFNKIKYKGNVSNISSKNEKKNNEPNKKSILDELYTNRTLTTEIFIASGRRKDTNDEDELGEDIAGIINIKDRVFAWVIDGASDGMIAYNPNNQNVIFSVRQIAKILSASLSVVTPQNSGKSLITILHQAIEETKTAWREITDGHEYLDGLKGKGVKLTIVFACLTQKGESSIISIGDSFGFGFQANGKITLKTDPKPSFLNFNLKKINRYGLYLNGENTIKTLNELSTQYNTPKIIDSLLLYSDGCKDDNFIKLMSKHISNIEDLRYLINYHPFRGADDKSMILIER